MGDKRDACFCLCSKNITNIVDSAGNRIRYVYDDLGQLIREDNGLLSATYVFEYDDAGNMTYKKKYDFTTSATLPDTPNNTYTYVYSTGTWGDLLTSFNGTDITYDGIGNPLSYYNGTAYTFSWCGRQLTQAVTGSKMCTFTYNDEGIRTSKTVNGVTTNYYLNGSQIVAEETNGNITVYIYDVSGAPMGFHYRASTYASGVWDAYWYEKNLHGDVVAVYNSSGAKLVSYIYDAWGDFRVTYHNGGASTQAAKNPFTYRGYYYDLDLKLYYLNSRYYDQLTSRFISADDAGYLGANGDLNSYNLYAYCSNNPVMYVDPSGHSTDSIWKTMLGFSVGVGLAVVTVAAVVASGGTLLVPVLIGASVGAGLNLTGQGVSNLSEGKEFFEDINYWNVALGGISGAAFATGIGGLGGAIAIGSTSNMGLSALEGNSWANIGFSAVVGGASAFCGFKLGKYVSNKLVSINTNLGVGDYVNMARVDGAGFLARNTAALMSKLYTIGPTFITGVTRGVSNIAGNRIGGLFN